MCNLYNITTNHEAMCCLFPKFGDVTNHVDPQLSTGREPVEKRNA
ncbi:hypothetical protein [Brucella pituitosa]|nr:hypothetical protein [Brucella pituitosa]